MMPDSIALDKQLRAEATKYAKDNDADVFLLNFEVLAPIDYMVSSAISKRSNRKKDLILILVTEGGSADAGYRIMRYLQGKYRKISIAATGWCKSAGTLMCIGAHELILGDNGELGPLDVQIVKADELDEQKSGLVAEAAFEKLQQEAYKFFMGFVKDIGASEYRVTLKTASEIATNMTVGMIQPIFDKLDPVTIGEDYRSNRLAQAYAERLNLHGKNLIRSRTMDALESLLSGYPAHSFVIDRKEAENLFRIVKDVPVGLMPVIDCLAGDAVYPRNRRSERSFRMEFLNDEPAEADAAQAAADAGASVSSDGRSDADGNGTTDVSGDPTEGSRAKPFVEKAPRKPSGKP